MAAKRESAGKRLGPRIPRLEWAFAALGLVLVLGTAAFLGLQGFADRSPPEISLRAGAVVQLRNGYLVPVEAVNIGGTTADSLIVEGILASAAGVAERSEMSFQYLPPNSPRTGGLFFTRDPRQFELRLKPLGYEAP